MTSSILKFGVVALGAGESKRMGAPKLLLPWNGQTILETLIETWRQLGAQQVAVVVRPPPNPIHDKVSSIDGVSAIINPAPQDGMLSSVQRAAEWDGWLNSIEHIVLALGDQPHIHRSTLEQLLVCSALHPQAIVQLTYRERPTHPIVFPRQLFEKIRGSGSVRTLNDFLTEHTRHRHFEEASDRALAEDLDTPEDYQRALRSSQKIS